jgi:multiple sugar transport system substrate-binding protein
VARFLTAVVLAVALVAGAAACSDEEDNGLISFLVSGDPEELAAYREVIDAYKEENPDAEVTLVEASDSDDLITRLSTSTAGGSPPDLFLINYRSYGQFAAKDAIESIDDRLGDSDAFAAEDFYPEALDAFRWQDEQLCLPQNVSSLVVYYNRDLFRRFRVAEPRAGWTWDDFVRTASLLTRDANGQLAQAGEPEAGAKPAAVHGLGVEPVLIRIAPFVWSNGGELVDDDEQPTRFTLDTPAAKQALQSFLELRTVQGVTPTDEEVESEDLEARFANGRLAMLLQSRRVTPTFRTIEDFDWDVAPLPAYGTPASILHSDAFCMTSGSEDKDAAWRFVEFALGTKGQEILAQTGRTVPSLKSVAGSDAFLDPAQKPKNSQVFLDVIPTIRHIPSISTWPEIEDVSEGILENGFYLGTPVDDVVRELDVKTRPLFARGESP